MAYFFSFKIYAVFPRCLYTCVHVHTNPFQVRFLVPVNFHSSKWTEKHNHFRIWNVNNCNIHVLCIRGEWVNVESCFLLVATTSVASLRKFTFLARFLNQDSITVLLLESFSHPPHWKAWDALWFLETFVLEFMYYKTRPGFPEIHPFSFDLAKYGVSVMYEAVQIWETEQSWWDVLPLLKPVKAWEVYIAQQCLPSNWKSWPCLEYVM